MKFIIAATLAVLLFALTTAYAQEPSVLVRPNQNCFGPNLNQCEFGQSTSTGANRRTSVGMTLTLDITPKPTGTLGTFNPPITVTTDNFRIGVTGCTTPYLPILGIANIPDAPDYSRVTVSWPGQFPPELTGFTCNGFTGITSNATVTIYRGYGGHPLFPPTFQKVIPVAADWPSEYASNATVTIFGSPVRVSGALHYNATTGVYTPMTQCVTVANSCPRKTGATYNYVIVYAQGMDSYFNAPAYTTWQYYMVNTQNGADLGYMAPSWAGPIAHNLQQFNFPLSGNIPVNTYLRSNWEETTNLQTFPSEWPGSNGLAIRFGPDN